MIKSYALIEDGFHFATAEAVSADAALDALNPSETGDYDTTTGTVWTTIHARSLDANGDFDEEDDDSRTYAIDPPEPKCALADHDFRSPLSVVGGIDSNPGVYGHGGGIISTEVCSHCGLYLVTDTWAQNPENGEQGLNSVEYRPADANSLAYVVRRRLSTMYDIDDTDADTLDAAVFAVTGVDVSGSLADLKGDALDLGDDIAEVDALIERIEDKLETAEVPA